MKVRSEAQLREQRLMFIQYLKSKTKAQDWHAVADAACDLREIDAKLEDRAGR